MRTRIVDDATTYGKAISSQQEALDSEKEALAALMSALADEVSHFTNVRRRRTEVETAEIILYNDSLLRTVDSFCLMSWMMLRKEQSLHQVKALEEVLS
ncbi:hypothetical protein [Paenibacillus agri]|uniref:Uncharacterized protein n=1 Tax=Paenibacillus agri TaxID=2744309 RepID=A0A850EPN1_9BACL|nr:hypothetical protein [Paenibacillus agri]NUU62915.1 hypothetical protein [Paenibacillus agri]